MENTTIIWICAFAAISLCSLIFYNKIKLTGGLKGGISLEAENTELPKSKVVKSKNIDIDQQGGALSEIEESEGVKIKQTGK